MQYMIFYCIILGATALNGARHGKVTTRSTAGHIRGL